jgi:hypothetical protein
VKRNRVRFVLLAAAVAAIVSCGMLTLPKEVAVQANPSVSMLLGGVSYSLYSGVSGGTMEGRRGSLDDILGASWLQDLLDRGIRVYDYRPADAEDDGVQQFLVHYRLSMNDLLGGTGEFDLSGYQDMIDELTGRPTAINDVSFAIPSMNLTETFDVEIPLGAIAEQLEKNTGALSVYTAYLPVQNGSRSYVFPDGVAGLPANSVVDFSVTLRDLDSLVLKDGKLDFAFALTYGPTNPPLAAGSTLTLSGFRLRDSAGKPLPNVTASGRPVTLGFNGATGKASLLFNDATLPKKFVLVCDLRIDGSGPGFFELKVEPSFDSFTISGASNLVVSAAQLASLSYDFPETIHAIGGGLGPSFKAVVETGNLAIDAAELFPPLDPARPDAEGWNLALDLSGLCLRQEPAGAVAGLSLGGPGQPLRSGDNDLRGETLNYQPVKIYGKAAATLAGGGNKLTFRNFPGGIAKGTRGAYKKQAAVRMDVALFSEVTVRAEDFGLDRINQTIEQDLAGDFTAFKDWLNYIHFPERGLGLELTIEKLRLVGGLGLYVDAPAFGIHRAFAPLKTAAGGEHATLRFLNEGGGGYALAGSAIPDKARVTVELGLEDPAAQQAYARSKLLTIAKVVPGETMSVTNATARLIFDWDALSVRPRKHTNGDGDDPVPTYPFAGTFPDREQGETGIDLGAMPTGLGFYRPEQRARGSPGEGAGSEGLDARLYLSLVRQRLSDGNWVDDSGGWNENLRINLPKLEVRVIYGDGAASDNLFTYEPIAENDTGDWTLSRPLDLEADDLGLVSEDEENADNPLKLYAPPPSSPLPHMDKAIPLGNVAQILNEILFGRQSGPLFLSYTMELVPLAGQSGTAGEPGEILIYPEMLTKRIVAFADLLLLIPLTFQADPAGSDKEDAPPVVVSFAPDTGEEDLFRRAGPGDKGYLDLITSLEFDLAIKNVTGLHAGKLFLENRVLDYAVPKHETPESVSAGGEAPGNETPEEKPGGGTFSRLIVDFANPRQSLSLTSEDLETIKGIWPFIPQLAIHLTSGEVLRIERNFAIELESITLKAGGEFIFETGL